MHVQGHLCIYSALRTSSNLSWDMQDDVAYDSRCPPHIGLRWCGKDMVLLYFKLPKAHLSNSLYSGHNCGQDTKVVIKGQWHVNIDSNAHFIGAIGG